MKMQTKLEYNAAEICCTCLKSNVQLTSTSECDSYNIDFNTKLKFCVPEVVSSMIFYNQI